MDTAKKLALEALDKIAKQYGKHAICCDHPVDGCPGDGWLSPPDPPTCCQQPDEDVQMLCDTIRAALSTPAAADAPNCSCPSGDGSLKWPCAAHPQASSPEPVALTDAFRAAWKAEVGSTDNTAGRDVAMRVMMAALAASQPAPSTTREFTNELDNRIRITIEGPTSTSENILTPLEVKELLSGLVTHHSQAATTPQQRAARVAVLRWPSLKETR